MIVIVILVAVALAGAFTAAWWIGALAVLAALLLVIAAGNYS